VCVSASIAQHEPTGASNLVASGPQPRAAAERPKRNPDNQRERADVPRTQLRHPVVRHVLPQAVPVDDRFFEQDPRVEKRDNDRGLDDAR